MEGIFAQSKGLKKNQRERVPERGGKEIADLEFRSRRRRVTHVILNGS